MLVTLKAAKGKPTPLFYGVVVVLLMLNVLPVIGLLVNLYPLPIDYLLGKNTAKNFPYLVSYMVAFANVPVMAYLMTRKISMAMKIVCGVILIASVGYLLYFADNLSRL